MIFLDKFGSMGAMDEPCTSSNHIRSTAKPKCTHFHTTERHWLCFTCSQEENRKAIANKYTPPCITGAEYTFRVLGGQYA